MNKTLEDEEEARLRAYEADYTPYGVAHQALSLLHELEPDFAPRSHLDPSAGSGVWCLAAHDVFGEMDTHAVEPREEEHLLLAEKLPWAKGDRITRSTFEDSGIDVDDSFDLIATNAPFSKTVQWVPQLFNLLTPGGFLLLYTKTNFGQRSVVSDQVMRSLPPKYMFPIYGTVRHRKYGGGDSQSYATWVWQRGFDRRTQIVRPERLSAGERRL